MDKVTYLTGELVLYLPREKQETTSPIQSVSQSVSQSVHPFLEQRTNIKNTTRKTKKKRKKRRVYTGQNEGTMYS